MSATGEASLRRWWRDPGEYGWLIQFMEARGLSRSMRRVVAVIGAVLAVLAGAMSLGPRVHSDPVARVLMVVIIVLGLCWAIRWWCWGWPSAQASILLLTAGDIPSRWAPCSTATRWPAWRVRPCSR